MQQTGIFGSKFGTNQHSAIHAIIAAEINQPDSDDAVRTAGVLERWDCADTVEPAKALQAAREFVGWVQSHYAPLAWHVEHPVTHVLDSGQVTHGFIDLLLEIDKGFVIVDYKATPRPRNEWQEIAVGYSGQLLAYKAAVEAATSKPVIDSWIHFAVGGGAVRLTWAAQSSEVDEAVQ